MMHYYKSFLVAIFIASILFLQGCAGTPVNLGVSDGFDRTSYDMENPRKVTASASGFQLLLLIPISVNDRHARAYSAIEAQAAGGLIADVRVRESWTYAFVGTIYRTTIEAGVYPHK